MVRPIKIYLQSWIEACITNELNEFTCISSYIAIYITILNNQMLKDSQISKFDKLWGKIFNTFSETLKRSRPEQIQVQSLEGYE